MSALLLIFLPLLSSCIVNMFYNFDFFTFSSSLFLHPGLATYPCLLMSITNPFLLSCDDSVRFRSLRSLFGQSFYKSNDTNKVTGVYELTLKQRADTGSPGGYNSLFLHLSCDSRVHIFVLFLRSATSPEESPWHLFYICSWGGKSTGLAAKRGFPHHRPSVGIGETDPPWNGLYTLLTYASFRKCSNCDFPFKFKFSVNILWIFLQAWDGHVLPLCNFLQWEIMDGWELSWSAKPVCIGV